MGFLKSIFNGHYSDNVLRDNEIKMNCSGCSYVIILCAIMLAFATLYDWSYYNLSTFIIVGLYVIAALCALYIVSCHLTQGKAKWLKIYAVGLFVITTAFLAFFTSSGLISLASIIPMAMASRYYSQRFTFITAIGTYLLLVAIIVGGTLFHLTDIQDLNYIQIKPGMSVTISGSIYNSFKEIAHSVVDTGVYLKRLLVFEVLPNTCLFVLLAIICMTVTARGKQMIEEQGEISSREAKIKHELATATAIQDNMLAEVFPVNERYELYAIMNPAKEVGGDFYDFFNLDDDHIVIVIGDVSDKGVPSALFMAMGGSIMHSYGELGYSPSCIFKETNRRLCNGNKEGMFITAFLGIVDLKTGLITYANAGHCAPLIKRANGEIEYLNMQADLFLGSIEGIEYVDQHMQLYPGDKILLYTDGVTEAMNKEEELLGKERLAEMVNNDNQNAAKDIVEALALGIKDFANGAEQNDDITMLLLELKEV